MSSDKHCEIWQELYEWMSEPEMYPSVLWIMELGALVVGDQKWVHGGEWPMFRAGSATRYMLDARLPRIEALNTDPVHKTYFPQTSAWLNAEPMHGAKQS